MFRTFLAAPYRHVYSANGGVGLAAASVMTQHMYGPIASMRVLVADDDEDMLSLVTDTLQSDGHEVRTARDGAELLECLEGALADPEGRPDVVVADVMMPRLSGLGVLEALCHAQLYLPVVLMTVLADDSVQTVARRFGAVGVLRKPFDVDDLRTAVMNAVLAYRARGGPR